MLFGRLESELDRGLSLAATMRRVKDVKMPETSAQLFDMRATHSTARTAFALVEGYKRNIVSADAPLVSPEGAGDRLEQKATRAFVLDLCSSLSLCPSLTSRKVARIRSMPVHSIIASSTEDTKALIRFYSVLYSRADSTS